MRVSRVYYPDYLKPRLAFKIDNQLHHYLSRVLRLSIGDEVRFFNGKGLEFVCAMLQCNRHESTFVCLREIPVLAEANLKITLYLAVCKNESMDYSIQKATELGIREIQPLISGRSSTRKTADGRREHWQKVARSACEQCGRATVPEISQPIALQEVEKIAKDDAAIICCVGAQSFIKVAVEKIVAKSFDSDAVFHLMIGPEGGFDTNELTYAISKGFEAVHLGDCVLRSETAVVAALSMLRFAFFQRF